MGREENDGEDRREALAGSNMRLVSMVRLTCAAGWVLFFDGWMNVWIV
jgi:hypothetical protein